VRAAAWLFGGGTVADNYKDIRDWALFISPTNSKPGDAWKSSTAVADLDLYHKMFLEDYKPIITSATVG
jgi:hypothetical protein